MNAINQVTDMLNASIALKQAIARLMLHDSDTAALYPVRRKAPEFVRRLERFEALAQQAACELAKEEERHV